MSFITEINNLITRVNDPSKFTDAQRRERVILYANGIESKNKQASFALALINSLSNQTPSNTRDAYGYDDYDKIHFYSDTFWALERSILDVLSQIVNQTENLGLDERSCDFTRVINYIQANHNHSPLLPLLSTLRNLQEYTQLDEYRNCSMHRRQVYLEYQQTSRAYTTPGYGNASGSVISHEWIVCENPLDVIPAITLRRLITPYCQNIFDIIENNVKTILNNLIP
ncbi:MAG: hypothetical protein IPM32_18270 [Ignavibacteriae bacterium]|nr:hypothetical protein [Ignavibacteriota bacterium]